MKHIEFGNILDVTEGILVHGCNAKGVMGGGLALQVKQKYPECFDVYRSFCKGFSDMSILGACIDFTATENLIISNAITQYDYGAYKQQTDYKAVKKVFDYIALKAYAECLHVHYPQIGSGLGGGDWALISEIIDNCFEKYPIVERTLWIYE